MQQEPKEIPNSKLFSNPTDDRERKQKTTRLDQWHDRGRSY